MSHRSVHRALRTSVRLRWTLVGLALAALVGSPLAIGAAQKKKKPATPATLVAGARNPAKGTLKTTTKLYAKTSGYGLQVSNSGLSAGGGLFSCTSIAGGTASKRPPCLRAANQSTGSAFEFAFHGPLGGVFQVGRDINRDFPASRPFVTNATGVATGLNADRVDGLHAQDIIDSAVARSSVQVGAQGPQGPAGPQGSTGQTGPRGPAGPAGTPLQSATSTTANSDLPSVGLTSTLPAANTSGDGVDLFASRALPRLDAGNTYIVQVTVRGFATQSIAPSIKHYVTSALFLDGTATPVVTLWTPDVPADGTNGATTSDLAVLHVTGGNGQLTLRAIDHSGASAGPPDADNAVAAGASVVVTQVNTIAP